MHDTEMKRRAGLRARAGLAAAGLLVAGTAVGWSAAKGTPAIAPVTAAPASIAVAEGATARTIGASVDSYADVVDRVAPAVVTIRSERRTTAVSQRMPDHPLFREFFGDRFRMDPTPRRESGLGSGVIVRPDGYILTNHHVVAEATTVNVELNDGRTLSAKVIGSDPPSDLAVLKIEASNLPTLTLGDSDAVRVGDVALAVGNPMGIGQTVTMGIISAKGRATGLGDGSFEDFIQTDAPINRGNSGGALVSTRGELIGINSQILSPSGGNIGIGFAIPANMARNVMTQLIEHGEVRRGMLGVTVQPLTADLARSLGLDRTRGALVNNVEGGSPAAGAGIRRGDVITAVDGGAVEDGNDLRNRISQLLPGTTARVTLVREGREQTVDVTLAELRDAARRHDGRGAAPEASGTFGLAVEPLTRDAARELGVRASSGVVVAAVQPGSGAEAAGLRAGDVITEVDRQAIATVDALRNALARGDGPALLLVHRGDATFFATLRRAG